MNNFNLCGGSKCSDSLFCESNLCTISDDINQEGVCFASEDARDVLKSGIDADDIEIIVVMFCGVIALLVKCLQRCMPN